MRGEHTVIEHERRDVDQAALMVTPGRAQIELTIGRMREGIDHVRSRVAAGLLREHHLGDRERLLHGRGDDEPRRPALGQPPPAPAIAGAVRRLAERGTPRIVIAETVDTALAITEVMLAQKARRYAETGRIDTLAHPAYREFICARHGFTMSAAWSTSRRSCLTTVCSPRIGERSGMAGSFG